MPIRPGQAAFIGWIGAPLSIGAGGAAKVAAPAPRRSAPPERGHLRDTLKRTHPLPNSDRRLGIVRWAQQTLECAHKISSNKHPSCGMSIATDRIGHDLGTGRAVTSGAHHPAHLIRFVAVHAVHVERPGVHGFILLLVRRTRWPLDARVFVARRLAESSSLCR